MKRHATAVWEGTGKEGNGSVTTQSTLLTDAQYSFSTRFEDGVGTNPEELVAAAHAGCFSMKLAFILNAGGFTADRIETKCVITLGKEGVTNADLTLNAKIDGISEEKFNEFATEAKLTCPISMLLNAEISLEATLA